MHTPDTSERRGAIKATASAGAVKAFRTARPEKPQPLTFAIRPSRMARTRRGSAEPGGCAAAAWRSGARRPDSSAGGGAEGGHRPTLFLGYGHGAAAEKVNQQDAGYDARDEEHRENQAEARYRQ